MDYVWIYLWKASRNHNKENPCTKTYKLLPMHWYTDDETNDLSDQLLSDYAEDWAEAVNKNGHFYGFSYGYEIENPPKEWLDKEIERKNKSVESINEEIVRLKEYL